MISEMAQCGHLVLVAPGLGAVGGLLMGLGAVKEKQGARKKALILAGAFCIFAGFMGLAYPVYERCCWLGWFWVFAIAVPILMLVALLCLYREMVCASARHAITALRNFFAMLAALLRLYRETVCASARRAITALRNFFARPWLRGK
jgi:hypothetical protein